MADVMASLVQATGLSPLGLGLMIVVALGLVARLGPRSRSLD